MTMLMLLMLDLNHPMTDHVFRAAGLLDRLKRLAQKMSIVSSSERKLIFEACGPIFEELQKLAESKFENSTSITGHLINYRNSIKALAELNNSQISESHKSGQGNCPACALPILGFDTKVKRLLPPEVEKHNLSYLWAAEPQNTWLYLCKHCTREISKIEQKLDSDEGFGTWAI